MLQIAEWVGLLCLPAFLLLDLVYRRHRFDAPRWWRLRATLVSAFTFFFSMAIAMFWGDVFADFSLVDGSGLGIGWGALVGILLYELFHYAYHRLAHKSDLLWRAAHQMHHSAESVDAFGAYYLHPLDTIAFTTLSSVVFFPILGLVPEAGALAAAFVAFNAMFQHANIRTPRWLGYVIQRPESHQLHHGAHRHNYCDLPLWDMLFGTFRNPETYEGRVGFYKGASARVGAMLVGRDVSRPPRPAEPEAARGVRSVA